MRAISICLALSSIFLLPAAAYSASSEGKGELANIFVQISKKMTPCVVSVFTTSSVRLPWSNGGQGGADDLWRRFFEEFFGDSGGGFQGPGPGGAAPKMQSLGSGFIIEVSNSGGLILTNNHVVEGAEDVKIKFSEETDEKESDGEVIGTDPDLDVALVKVTTRRKLQAVVLADSDKLEVGEWIAAVGNPFGHGHSISHGIVSAKERALPGGFGKYLQVDAPINPGNSGGPLVNLAGEVVGINNAIDARGPGIGFAIPINAVKAVLPQLKTKGRVERGYIGISVDDLGPEAAKSLKLDDGLKAPIVTNVIHGQPADKAGLQLYDVVTAVNGASVHSAAELVEAITSVSVGEHVKIAVMRSGKEKVITVNVTRRPDLMADSRRGGKATRPKSPRVDAGMVVEDVDADVAREIGLPENYKGVVISQVTPGGPAYDAGLMRGDVILEVERKQVQSVEGFYKAVTKRKTYLLRVRKQDDGGHETFAVVALKLAAVGEN